MELAERQGTPIIYVQDVSGFMVGTEAESEGIIRAGAEMVETMSCATVPRIVLTINHASGAGYYAMAGQGFDPNFTFSWPTARIGVMEGDSAVQALFSAELEKLKQAGEPVPEELAGIHRSHARRLRALARCEIRRRARPLRRHDRSGRHARRSDPRARSRAAPPARDRPCTGDSLNDSHRQRPGILGRLAGSSRAPGRTGTRSIILVLDYLAEVTMSILQKQKQADPALGYARDFPPLIGRLASKLKERNIKVIANAGGVNPAACARAVLKAAPGLKVAVVHGDDVFDRIDELPRQGLRNARHGYRRAALRHPLAHSLGANAYIGAFPLAEALDTGADVVIAGRSTDTALTLAPDGAPVRLEARRLGQTRRGHHRGAHHRMRRAVHRRQLPGGLGDHSRTWRISAIRLSKRSRTARFTVTKHAGAGGRVTLGYGEGAIAL